jgi:hypothetical protein
MRNAPCPVRDRSETIEPTFIERELLFEKGLNALFGENRELCNGAPTWPARFNMMSDTAMAGSFIL